MTPTITVVIPLYNKRDYIERCLRSVRAQTFTDYQIVVVNDGSTDGGEKLVEPFLREGDLLINQENGGHAVARNRGFAAAEADLIASLDADDEWLPRHLADIWELSQRFPEAGLLSTGVRRRTGRLVVDTYLAGAEPRLVNYFRICNACPLNSSSVAIRRDAFEQSGGFLPNQPVLADWEYWGRIALEWPVALHPEVSSVYHVDASGTAIIRKGPRGLSGYALVYGMLEKALQQGRVRPEMEADVRASVAAQRHHLAVILILKGLVKQAADVLTAESMMDGSAPPSVPLLRAYTRLARWLPEGSRTAALLGATVCFFRRSPWRLLLRVLGLPRRHGELIIWERLVRHPNDQ